jgi:hypothetical protein
MCLFYSSVLPLDIYILQLTALTVPQQPVLLLDSSKSPAAYAACPWTRTGTGACVLPLDVPVLQQPMLPLDVSVQQQHLLPLDLLVPALEQTLLLVCVSIAD